MLGLQMADLMPDDGCKLALRPGDPEQALEYTDLAAGQHEGVRLRLGEDLNLPAAWILTCCHEEPPCDLRHLPLGSSVPRYGHLLPQPGPGLKAELFQVSSDTTNGAIRSQPDKVGATTVQAIRCRALRRVRPAGTGEGLYASLQVHIVPNNSSAAGELLPPSRYGAAAIAETPLILSNHAWGRRVGGDQLLCSCGVAPILWGR